jgi:hypothetical protein
MNLVSVHDGFLLLQLIDAILYIKMLRLTMNLSYILLCLPLRAAPESRYSRSSFVVSFTFVAQPGSGMTMTVQLSVAPISSANPNTSLALASGPILDLLRARSAISPSERTSEIPSDTIITDETAAP